jgi:Fe2+ transport system protein FeoA
MARTRAHESYICRQAWPWITGSSRSTKDYRTQNARLNGMGLHNGVSVRPIEIKVNGTVVALGIQ